MQTIFTIISCIVICLIHLSQCALQVDIKYQPSTTISDASVETASKAAEPKVPESRGFGTGNYRSSYVGGTKFNRKVLNHRNSARVIKTEVIDDSSSASGPSIESSSVEAPIQLDEFGSEIRYNVGPGVNISVEKDKELVSVYLDEDCLKDVFTGRGKRQDLITKILPLFILPFLIQSAVVPFLVSTLKLLLIKSIVVGKIAIFLLLLSAFKNHVRYAYENSPSPSYYSDIPNRRTENAILGYRVEGKPATWIN